MQLGLLNMKQKPRALVSFLLLIVKRAFPDIFSAYLSMEIVHVMILNYGVWDQERKHFIMN
jgi:hypothetical protein